MQSSDLIELSQTLSEISDVDEFWDKIGAELSNFGVTNFLYGSISSKAEVREKGFADSVVLKMNYPEEYLNQFAGNEFLETDVTAYRALEKTELSFWHHVETWDEADLDQKTQLEMEMDLGLSVGITLPTELLSADSLGGISICTGELLPQEFDKMWMEHVNHISQILGLLDVGMRQQHLSTIIRLAPREKEVLTWLASGLKPDEIADRLGIGYRTVDKYIVSAKRRLKAKTRDQAVAKALIFNVIQP